MYEFSHTLKRTLARLCICLINLQRNSLMKRAENNMPNEADLALIIQRRNVCDGFEWNPFVLQIIQYKQYSNKVLMLIVLLNFWNNCCQLSCAGILLE